MEAASSRFKTARGLGRPTLVPLKTVHLQGWGPNPCPFGNRRPFGGPPTLVHLDRSVHFNSRPHYPFRGPQPFSIWKPPVIWRVSGAPNPCPFGDRPVRGLATFVHLKGWAPGLVHWRPPCPFGGLGVREPCESNFVGGGGGLIKTDTVAWRPSLATHQGSGRQALQPGRACQGLAGARQRPPTHSRRGVVGGFRV